MGATRTRTRHAAPGARVPDFAACGRRSLAGDEDSEATECSAAAARRHRRQPGPLPDRGTRRDRLNRLDAVFEQTDRAWDAERLEGDDHLFPDGRMMEVLREHLCQGWLEGYLLTAATACSTATGLHPHCRLDVQPARQVAQGEPRDSVAAADRLVQLPAVLSRWRQDHNGFSHQDPGFIDHVLNKKAEVVPLPAARRQLSVVGRRPLAASRDYVNVMVAGKQPALDYLTMEEAISHCTRGIGIWEWASSEGDERSWMSCSLARRHPDARGGGRRLNSRERLPELKVRWSTSST